jgi:hypothetical protein
MAQVQISKILPRHIEIMNRLLLGQKEVEIANDLGLSQSRLSVIVQSPLFQLELKKQIKKRQARVLAIEDTIIDASEAGAKLLKETAENDNIILPFRIDAGNKALTHLFGRIVRTMPSPEALASDNPDDMPYEKRLEREITIKETTYVPKNGGNVSQYETLPDDLDSEEDEMFEDEVEDEKENVIPDEVTQDEPTD